MIQQFGEEFELNIIKQHLARDIKKRNHQFTNLKRCIKAREPFKPPFQWLLFLIYIFKNYFRPLKLLKA